MSKRIINQKFYVYSYVISTAVAFLLGYAYLLFVQQPIAPLFPVKTPRAPSAAPDGSTDSTTQESPTTRDEDSPSSTQGTKTAPVTPNPFSSNNSISYFLVTFLFSSLTGLIGIFRILIIFFFFYYIWDFVQSRFTKTPAWKAVLFCFIPVINFYWYYYVIVEWTRVYNKLAATSEPRVPSLSTALPQAIYCVWAIEGVIGVTNYINTMIKLFKGSMINPAEITPLMAAAQAFAILSAILFTFFMGNACRAVNDMANVNVIRETPNQKELTPKDGSGWDDQRNQTDEDELRAVKNRRNKTADSTDGWTFNPNDK